MADRSVALPELFQAFGADEVTNDPMKCIDAIQNTLGQCIGVMGMLNVAASHGELEQDDAVWSSQLVLNHLRLVDELVGQLWESTNPKKHVFAGP